MFSISPLPAYPFCCWSFQQLHYFFLGRVLSKLNCGRSWHFLLHSVIAMIYLLFFVLEALRCCSFHPSSHFVKDCVLFMIVHLTGVLCPFAQVPFALSSLASLLNRSASRICSYLLLFLNGLLSTSFISVVLFSQSGLTSSRFFGFTHSSKEQLSFTSPLFSSVVLPVPF